MTLPVLPTEGEYPWFAKRAAWDAAVEAALEGRLSDTSLEGKYALIAHTQAVSTITGLTEAVQDIVGAMLIPTGTMTIDYNDSTGQVTFSGGTGTVDTVAGVEAIDGDVPLTAADIEADWVLEYSGSAWPARPSTTRTVVYRSTKHVSAPAPTGASVGDVWDLHPDAS